MILFKYGLTLRVVRWGGCGTLKSTHWKSTQQNLARNRCAAEAHSMDSQLSIESLLFAHFFRYCLFPHGRAVERARTPINAEPTQSSGSSAQRRQRQCMYFLV